METTQDIVSVASRFQFSGDFLTATPYGSGHINDTYCAAFLRAGVQMRYILQRINRRIFKNPPLLMENIERITSHLAQRSAGEPDSERRVLTPIPTWEGPSWHLDESGEYWRAYRFIERARTYECVTSGEQAFQAARAFGRFQRLLTDLPAPRLHDTLPDFHHTPKRFQALEAAIAADTAGRGNQAGPEIEFALARRSITSTLIDAGLPERVTHNDTKLNNVMIDDATGEGICIIDLDTVMNGSVLYDFGDMVRTATSPAAEDERDLSKVELQFPMFEALVRGYLASAGEFLSPQEKHLLTFAGKLITFEIGIRFLTDFLAGDTYFKVHREGHNLDRCRTQFKLVESIERQETQLVRLVESIAG